MEPEAVSNYYGQAFLPVICTCAVLMLIGITGNSIVIYVYWFKFKGTAKRTFILVLALMDITVCALVIPFEMYDLLNQFTFHSVSLCIISRVFEYGSVLSSGFTLVGVSFERYYSICKAFQEFTPKKANIICLICVIAGVILSLPVAMFAGAKERFNGAYNVTGLECAMDSTDETMSNTKTVYYCCLALIFSCILVTFVVIYSTIAVILCRLKNAVTIRTVSKETLHGTQLSASSPNISRHGVNKAGASTRMKIHGRRGARSTGSTVVFFSVTVVFVVSYLPHIGVRLVKFLHIPIVDHLNELSRDVLYNFLVRSYLISNVVNPFIYSIFNTRFRKELVRTVRKLCCRRDGMKPLS